MISHSLATRIRLEIFRRAKYLAFMASGGREARRVLRSLPPHPHCVYVVVAFNEVRLLKVQLRLLREQSYSKFEYLVLDNSPDRATSRSIRSFAADAGARYARLPKNWYSNSRGAAKPGRGSLSHSVALDWVWAKILAKLQPNIVVLLDHDVFPISRFSIEEAVGNKIAVGPIRVGSERWTLWPGLVAFRMALVNKKNITFMPSGDLDSGAGLWSSLIKHHPPEAFGQMPRRLIHIAEGEHPAKDELEIIGSTWFHLGDGSGWFDGVSKVDFLISHSKLNPAIPSDIEHVARLLQEQSRDASWQ